MIKQTVAAWGGFLLSFVLDIYWFYEILFLLLFIGLVSLLLDDGEVLSNFSPNDPFF